MLIYCATTNKGKLAEFRLAADRYAAGCFHLEPLPGLSAIAAPEETGVTLEENATLKARYYSRHATELVFADDSGLVVDALDGAPGVYSSHFSGPQATDASNNALLLERMRGVTPRTARFVCIVALARAGGILRTFHGVVEGTLLDSPRGSHGFGYDPLFYYPDYGCTLAECDGERKLEVSHRGRALQAMFTYLRAEASRPAAPPSSSRR
ncbi:MAG: RdgB/HAM1 family non-canonical purine NTP pyrophosphatase [Acidimicrobiia bacterium]|nr:RdgB/HAM1 family non-canonical purine NTP pyrophosphatase [Acidimicrobiia bacterium]